VASLSAEGEAEGAEAARKALWATQQALDTRAAELAALERERKFNADEMCYVAKEKSLVGRQALCGSRARQSAHAEPARRGVSYGADAQRPRPRAAPLASQTW
jgi:hypothetical protein